MNNCCSTRIAILCYLLLLGGNLLAQHKIESPEEFPILAWWSIPEEETSIERFKELKESGINISFTPYSNIKELEKALDAAQKAGVKIYASCPELKTDPEATVKRLKKHPALFGYHLTDEPNASAFKKLGEWVRKIQAVDNEHPCYINLLPNWVSPAGLGNESYEQHVDQFLQEVPIPILSFDHYPLTVGEDNQRRLGNMWYQNLELISSKAKAANIPFWAFAMTTAHAHYPVPTIADIKLQMYSNLAYGAQGLQYFTYWTPEQGRDQDFHHGPIGLDWKRTEVYDRVKLVNQEMQNYAGVFLGATLKSVVHTGKTRPSGTRYVDMLPEQVKVFETHGAGAIVSILEKKGYQFLVVVNRDFEKSMKLTIYTDDKVKKVLKDGSCVSASIYTPTIEIDPADMVIYMWEN